MRLEGQVRKLLNAVTVNGAGQAYQPIGARRTFQATGQTSAGAGTADVIVEGSNDGTNWTEIGTITLVLSSTISNGGFASEAPWRHVRGRVANLTGTNAAVSLNMGL